MYIQRFSVWFSATWWWSCSWTPLILWTLVFGLFWATLNTNIEKNQSQSFSFSCFYKVSTLCRKSRSLVFVPAAAEDHGYWRIWRIWSFFGPKSDTEPLNHWNLLLFFFFSLGSGFTYGSERLGRSQRLRVASALPVSCNSSSAINRLKIFRRFMGKMRKPQRSGGLGRTPLASVWDQSVHFCMSPSSGRRSDCAFASILCPSQKRRRKKINLKRKKH